MRPRVVVDQKKPTLQGMIRELLLPASMIFTDEYPPYVGLERYFKSHRRIPHKQNIYVQRNVHTQTVEGFFGLLAFRNNRHDLARLEVAFARSRKKSVSLCPRVLLHVPFWRRGFLLWRALASGTNNGIQVAPSTVWN